MEIIILENLTKSVTDYDKDGAAGWAGEVISDQFAAGISADSYGPTAPGGVALCRRMLER